MSRSLPLILILAIALLGAEEELAPHDKWTRIAYPELPVEKPEDVPARVVLIPGKSGMNLQISFALPDEKISKDYPPPFIEVAWHAPEGRQGERHIERGPEIGKRGSSQIFYVAALPWFRNTLDEAWIELKLGARRYWLEIPYGFTRKPDDPLPAPDVRGRPVFAPAMKNLGAGDWIVQVQHVEYELGKVDGSTHLLLKLANPFDCEAELEMYRESRNWDLRKPATQVSLHAEGRAVGLRLHDDGYRRSDTFKFNRNPRVGRGFLQAEVRIGSKPYRFTIPTSLTNYVHGQADPYFIQRIRRKDF